MKLVRVDGDDQFNAELPNGKVEIGRGPFLKCSDKRVSRQHASLEVSDNEKVIVTALHNNPCFYQKKEETGLKILHKDQSTELSIGDKIQLLPSLYCYELVSDQSPINPSNVHESKVVELAKKATKNGEDDNHTIEEAISSLEKSGEAEQQDQETGEKLEEEKLPVKEEPLQTEELESKRKLPRWMLDNQANQTRISVSPEKPAAKKHKAWSVSKSPPTSPVSPKEELSEETTKSSEVDEPIGAASRRPACQYGSSCYRRNPAHKKEFSHPGDDDYAEVKEAQQPDVPDENDNRPECEYGLTCYRKNPRHREAFKHTEMPIPTRAAKRRGERKRRTDLEEGDEDNEYDLEDPFINDRDEDTSDYIPSDDEEDDDWNVKEGDDREIGDLLKEARDFMRNKKLQEPV